MKTYSDAVFDIAEKAEQVIPGEDAIADLTYSWVNDNRPYLNDEDKIIISKRIETEVWQLIWKLDIPNRYGDELYIPYWDNGPLPIVKEPGTVDAWAKEWNKNH